MVDCICGMGRWFARRATGTAELALRFRLGTSSTRSELAGCVCRWRGLLLVGAARLVATAAALRAWRSCAAWHMGSVSAGACDKDGWTPPVIALWACIIPR